MKVSGIECLAGKEEGEIGQCQDLPAADRHNRYASNVSDVRAEFRSALTLAAVDRLDFIFALRVKDTQLDLFILSIPDANSNVGTSALNLILYATECGS